MSKEERLQKYHNRGQEDAAKGYGNYDPPAGVVRAAIVKDDAENNAAYRAGYEHGVSQRDK